MSFEHEQLRPRFPLLALLHPRQQTRLVLLVLVPGLLLWGMAVALAGMRVWVASAGLLALLMLPATRKWRDDLQRYGLTAMVLSMLLAAQGFHTLEHISQMVEYHLLDWPPHHSHGLISAADAEWVHFSWNWLVVGFVLYLLRHGARNRWMWVLLAWALAHSLEHTYMTVRYLMVRQTLVELGFPTLSAQGLPGILGRDGWLARRAVEHGLLWLRLPGLTTLPRLDIHFWWNAGEMAWLLLGAHTYLSRQAVLQSTAAAPPVPPAGQSMPLGLPDPDRTPPATG